MDFPLRAPTLREATREDLPQIVALLADDVLGRAREAQQGDLAPYEAAFAAIEADPAHILLVACDGAVVVGTLQLSFIPGLSRGGALRAQIEGVRVHSSRRGSGLGAELVRWSVEEARRRGCALVQLTTDNQRDDAHRFYAGLGFVATHVGFKLTL